MSDAGYFTESHPIRQWSDRRAESSDAGDLLKVLGHDVFTARIVLIRAQSIQLLSLGSPYRVLLKPK